MKLKIKTIGLKSSIIALLSICILYACDNEDINSVDKKEQYYVTIPTSASSAEIFEDQQEGISVPIALGYTVSEPSSVTFEISSISGSEYGVDYKTVPDGSTGKVTIDLPVGASSIDLTILPIKTEDVDTKIISVDVSEVSGGLLLASESVPFEVTIADQTLNLTVLASTSFEEPLAGLVNNYSAQEGTGQINVEGLNSVDYVSTGGEMGFDLSYLPGQEGGEDDEVYFGVTNVVSEPDAWDIGFFQDGAQAYVTSDADGLAELVFDQISIPSGTEFLKIRLSTYFVDASWEEDDEFDVFWRTNSGDELLLSFRSNGESMTDAPDGNGNILIDQWFTFDAFVDNIDNGRLVIQIGTNSGSEVAFIDAIEIGIK